MDPSRVIVLAADIGATNARLALVDMSAARPRRLETRVYASESHESLGQIVDDFVGLSGTLPAAGCLGVPGPVHAGRARITNLPWVVEEEELSRALRGAPVLLINDLEAAAWGVSTLEADEKISVVGGDAGPLSSGVLVAAGTGLGVAQLVSEGGELLARASEGGHMTYAPHDARGRELSAWLEESFGRASWERVVSGRGLVNVCRFLVEVEGVDAVGDVRRTLEGEDPDPALIASAGLEARCEASALTLRFVVDAWGRLAGDLALAMLPDAVFLGGGLAPRLLPLLRAASFEESFRSKGRLRAAIERIPVRVVLAEDLGLRGAARRARILAGEALP